MRIEAPAKINLFLEVLGKRPDGYHEIVTVMQTIGLSDVLEVDEAEGFEISVEGVPIPPGGENLVLKAARLLAEAAGIRKGVRFSLLKRIPPGAGMGGGSSDAAAALLALDRVWGLKASREDLAGVAARVGSDVPFFLHGGTALCRGRGEIVEPLGQLPALPLLLVWPGLALSTRLVYEAVEAHGGGARDVRGFLAALEKGDPESACFNRLEDAALRVAPALAEVPRWMGGLGLKARMTGSGSAFYGLGPARPGPAPPAWRVFPVVTV